MSKCFIYVTSFLFINYYCFSFLYVYCHNFISFLHPGSQQHFLLLYGLLEIKRCHLRIVISSYHQSFSSTKIFFKGVISRNPNYTIPLNTIMRYIYIFKMILGRISKYSLTHFYFFV